MHIKNVPHSPRQHLIFPLPLQSNGADHLYLSQIYKSPPFNLLYYVPYRLTIFFTHWVAEKKQANEGKLQINVVKSGESWVEKLAVSQLGRSLSLLLKLLSHRDLPFTPFYLIHEETSKWNVGNSAREARSRERERERESSCTERLSGARESQ